jgi:flagellar biosynthesis component FlhA
MSTRESLAKLAEVLREWQHVENATVVHTAQIIDGTRNPVIRLVMEIIQSDSAMHHRVQQLLLDTLERAPVTLSVDDLEKVWEAIEAHVEAEKRTGELVARAREALAGTREVVAQYLLSYLAQDEAKHDRLLEDLALVKRGMFKSA